jgi:acetyl esterase/lipase
MPFRRWFVVAMTAKQRQNGVRDQREIGEVRALLQAKERPVGWAARRERIDDVCSHWAVADDVAVSAVDAGGVACEWSLAPGGDESLVLLYLHGGGFCSGSLRSHRRMVTEAGRAAGVRTLAVGYRLAPEHPFPAALDDATTAWHWLRGQGIAADRIVVGGDSAGGGLTVALIDRLRAASEDLPACAWLVSPWTDLTLTGGTMSTNDDVDPLIHRAYLAELASAYVPAGIDRTDPRVSVLYADLSGLPPTLVQVGSDETLLDDATRFASAAGAARVPVTLEVYPYMIHAFPVWNAHLDAGRRALEQLGAFARGHL